MVKQAFIRKFNEGLRPYLTNNTADCKVVLFEEETIYHSKMSGGLFWAGSLWPDDSSITESNDKFVVRKGRVMLRLSRYWDTVFIDRFSAIYRLLHQEIKRVAPECKIGIHIGHAPLYRNSKGETIYKVANPDSVYREIMEKLSPRELPDFTFYDNYIKVTKSSSEYFVKLQARFATIRSALPNRPIYHLAQLHTSGYFLHGQGRTPSQKQLWDTVRFDLQHQVEGFGFYTRNATVGFNFVTDDNGERCEWTSEKTGKKLVNNSCSHAEDSEPLEPNVTADMVFNQPPYHQRWWSGLKILEYFLAH